MASEDFDIFEGRDTKGQQMKASEITGERFYFHSLPKEFQDLHSYDFILEARGEIDMNKTTKAVLNGYMWLTIGDASKFGVASAVAIIASIIKIKLSPDLFGFFIAFLFYVPWMLYLMYHFTFYAYIRAQIVGPVTKVIAEKTVFTFYNTFIAVTASLLIAFLVFCLFLKDIAELLASLARYGAEKDSFFNIGSFSSKEIFVLLHNWIADFINGPQDILGQVLSNEWIMAIMFTGLTAFCVFYFEKEHFNKRLEEVDYDVKRIKTQSGYPIESALDCLWTWRRENNV